jgi:hypothetical protein
MRPRENMFLSDEEGLEGMFRAQMNIKDFFDIEQDTFQDEDVVLAQQQRGETTHKTEGISIRVNVSQHIDGFYTATITKPSGRSRPVSVSGALCRKGGTGEATIGFAKWCNIHFHLQSSHLSFVICHLSFVICHHYRRGVEKTGESK